MIISNDLLQNVSKFPTTVIRDSEIHVKFVYQQTLKGRQSYEYHGNNGDN